MKEEWKLVLCQECSLALQPALLTRGGAHEEESRSKGPRVRRVRLPVFAVGGDRQPDWDGVRKKQEKT